jgi:hypothetical protein
MADDGSHVIINDNVFANLGACVRFEKHSGQGKIGNDTWNNAAVSADELALDGHGNAGMRTCPCYFDESAILKDRKLGFQPLFGCFTWVKMHLNMSICKSTRYRMQATKAFNVQKYSRR